MGNKNPRLWFELQRKRRILQGLSNFREAVAVKDLQAAPLLDFRPDGARQT